MQQLLGDEANSTDAAFMREQSWESYFENVIYYILLIYYFLVKVIFQLHITALEK